MTKSLINKSKRIAKRRKLKAMHQYSEQASMLWFKGNKHIYAQLIKNGQALAGFNASQKDLKDLTSKEATAKIGYLIAQTASAFRITSAHLDRNGFQYHGLIKIMCEACRSGGLIK